MNSITGINNSATTAYTVYDPASNKQLISSIRKSNPSAKKKKKLNYSFKQIQRTKKVNPEAADYFRSPPELQSS